MSSRLYCSLWQWIYLTPQVFLCSLPRFMSYHLNKTLTLTIQLDCPGKNHRGFDNLCNILREASVHYKVQHWHTPNGVAPATGCPCTEHAWVGFYIVSLHWEVINSHTQCRWAPPTTGLPLRRAWMRWPLPFLLQQWLQLHELKGGRHHREECLVCLMMMHLQHATAMKGRLRPLLLLMLSSKDGLANADWKSPLL